MKVMLMAVFDIEDAVHHEFLHQGAKSKLLVLSRSAETSKRKS
jgi:hypothetical protein